MQEFWINSEAGLTDLAEIGVRVPNSAKKKAAYIWLDYENQLCSAGAVSYTDKSELNKVSFALKSNLDFAKVARVIKFESRRNGKN